MTQSFSEQSSASDELDLTNSHSPELSKGNEDPVTEDSTLRDVIELINNEGSEEDQQQLHEALTTIKKLSDKVREARRLKASSKDNSDVVTDSADRDESSHNTELQLKERIQQIVDGVKVAKLYMLQAVATHYERDKNTGKLKKVPISNDLNADNLGRQPPPVFTKVFPELATGRTSIVVDPEKFKPGEFYAIIAQNYREGTLDVIINGQVCRHRGRIETATVILQFENQEAADDFVDLLQSSGNTSQVMTGVLDLSLENTPSRMRLLPPGKRPFEEPSHLGKLVDLRKKPNS
jgi:hypothetical protein